MTDPEIELHNKVETRDSKGHSSVRELVVHQSVLDAMAGHVSQDTTVEHGGVMLGDVDEKAGTVTITGSIAAVDAVSKVASLTFTHETWDHISEIHERSFPDQKMVGWYHSHPHFGIFLSEHDLFIHRNFFTEPWQVAYVIDPLLAQEGFFVWEDGDVARLPAWRVISDGGTPQAHLGVSEPARGEAPPPAAPPKRGPGRIVFMIAVALIALIVGAVGATLIQDSDASSEGNDTSTTVAPSARVAGQVTVESIPCRTVVGTPTNDNAVTASESVLFTTNGVSVTSKQEPDATCPLIGSPSLPPGDIVAIAAIVAGSDAPQDDVAALYRDGTVAIADQTEKVDTLGEDAVALAVRNPGGNSDGLVYVATTSRVFVGRIGGSGFDPVSARPLDHIRQIAVWGGQPVIRTETGPPQRWDATRRAWSPLGCADDTKVLAVTASGDELWYLAQNQFGVHFVRHWESKQSCATSVTVGSAAQSLSASGAVAWVDQGANGGVVRIAADGTVDYLLQEIDDSPATVSSNAFLAGTREGLWVVEDREVSFLREPGTTDGEGGSSP